MAFRTTGLLIIGTGGGSWRGLPFGSKINSPFLFEQVAIAHVVPIASGRTFRAGGVSRTGLIFEQLAGCHVNKIRILGNQLARLDLGQPTTLTWSSRVGPRFGTIHMHE